MWLSYFSQGGIWRLYVYGLMIEYMIVHQQVACQKADVDRRPPIHPSPATHVSVPPHGSDTCTHLPPFTPHPINRTPAKNPPQASSVVLSRTNFSSNSIAQPANRLGRHLESAKNELAHFGGTLERRIGFRDYRKGEYFDGRFLVFCCTYAPTFVLIRQFRISVSRLLPSNNFSARMGLE